MICIFNRFILALSLYAKFVSLIFMCGPISLYASQNHLTFDQGNKSLTKPLLTPSALFANITQYPDDVENKRLEALKQGIQFKLANNNVDARICFEKAAILDAPSAMHHLGMLASHNKADWFILAFQVHWIQTGKYLSISCNALEDLRSSDEKAASFLKDLKRRYPENANKPGNLYKMAQAYETSLEEPYLTEQERIEKAFRFFKAVNDKQGDREIAQLFFTKKMSRCFTEAEQAEQAVAYALRSCDPISLLNAGIYYQTGQVGQDIRQEERYKKAFSCFIDSKDPQALFEAGVLLFQGKVKKPNAIKLAASYYKKSNLPNAIFNLGVLWRDGYLGNNHRYQNAIEFFLSSNLPQGKYNAAVLYRDGLTGDNMTQEKRDIKAVSLLLEAESSFPLAQAVLGYMYKRNRGVPPSLSERKRYAEAERLYEAACKHNIVSAFHNLGLMYQSGEAGITLSERERTQKALGLFKEASNLSGSPDSKVRIAAMLIGSNAKLLEGSQAERDKEAFQLLCECEGAESQALKGAMLLEDRALLDLSEDARYKLAQDCFENSSEPIALYSLGVMHWREKTEKKLNKEDRLKKAIELFKASGTPEAKADLGLLLYEYPQAEPNLRGQERDQIICELFQDSKTDIGKAGLGAMYLHGRAGKDLLQSERDQKAIFLFNEAQTPASYNNLATLYIEERLGSELPKTERIQKAIDCLIKAIQPSDISKKRCAAAYLNLGLMYVIEESIRDVNHALHLFHIAALEGVAQAAVYRDVLVKCFFGQEDIFSAFPTLEEISLHKKSLINTNSAREVEEKVVANRESDQNQKTPIFSPQSSFNIKEVKKHLKQYDPEAKLKKKLFKKSLKNQLTQEEKGQLLSSAVQTVNNKIKVEFIGKAEKQYNSWKQQKGYHASKIDDLIREAFVNPNSKRGKPEALEGDLKGWWSRRIDDEHRLVYKLTPDSILIKSCKKHYQ